MRGWVNSCGSLRFSVLVAVTFLALAFSPDTGLIGKEAALSERPPEFNLDDVSDEAELLSTVLLAFFFPNMGVTKSLSFSFVSVVRNCT
ncbi:hypothetical protein [Thalassospira alkalitolerans]|uniref:hypothetical protein n=1 Tax=Thalassospira alkalitolerans TaxID=1293890 RepID=UPI0030EEE5A6